MLTLLTSLTLGNPTCGGLKFAYRNSTCCPSEGGAPSDSATCPTGCVEGAAGLQPVTAEQVGTHTYFDIPGEYWDAETHPSNRSAILIRYNLPVVASDGVSGPEMPVFYGDDHYNDHWTVAISGGLTPPLRPRRILTKPWLTGKKFPVIVVIAGGGVKYTAAGFPGDQFGPSVRLAYRYPLDGDFVVLDTIGDGAAGEWSPQEIHRMLTWAIANLPIDETRILLTGHSTGAQRVWNYLGTYKNEALGTHYMPLDGAPTMLTYNGLLQNSKKVYAVNQIHFDHAYKRDAFVRTLLPNLAKVNANVRMTTVNSLTSSGYDLEDVTTSSIPIPGFYNILELYTKFYTMFGWDAPRILEYTEHTTLGIAGVEFYQELGSKYELRTADFPPGVESCADDAQCLDAKGSRVVEYRIASGGSGYNANDKIVVDGPYKDYGGQPFTFTILAEHLNSEGTVISAPPLTSPGLLHEAYEVFYDFETTLLAPSVGGQGLTVQVHKVSGDYEMTTSTFEASLNQPMMNYYEWFMEGYTAPAY